MVVSQAIEWAIDQLKKIPDPVFEAELLLAQACEKNRAFVKAFYDASLNAEQLGRFERWVKRRSCGEPIAYILGEQEFWSLPLYVSEHTLIPRADTECLVEFVISQCQQVSQNSWRILDLGTGSGAIAIALASELTSADILAVDSSAQALEVAKRNVGRHGLTNVALRESDWYKNVGGVFNFIVTNPPYIDANDVHLQQGDLRFEPRSALVSESNGLRDIQKIIDQGRRYLAPKGLMVLEHGWEQGAEVEALLRDHGFSHLEAILDLAGHHRCTAGRWQVKELSPIS